MLKNITCPHCQCKLKIGLNCYNDNDNCSLICKKCQKIVLPTIIAHDESMPKSNFYGKRNFCD